MYSGLPRSLVSAIASVSKSAAIFEDEESVNPLCCDDYDGARVALRGSMRINSSSLPMIDVTVIRL